MAYTPATVNAWFNAVQFRDGPAATVASYVSLLNSGSLTPASVQLSIIQDQYTSSYVNPMLRIYQAAFNRVPDAAGQNFWTDNFAAGKVTTLTASQDFANSTEFKAAYGNTSASDPINAATLTAIYQNVLNRNPDAAGYQFWLNSGQNIAQVLNFFAQSPEFVVAAQTPTILFQEAQIAGNAATTGSLFQYGGFPPAETFTLTTNTDTFSATKGNTVFNAYENGGAATWTVGDSISGLSGDNDTFNIVQTKAIVNPFATTVSGIETINATSGLTGTILNTTGFSGATAVNVTAPGAVTLTGATTTALNVTNSALGGSAIAVNGGSNVAVNATSAVAGGTVGVVGASGTVAVNNIVNAAGAITGVATTVTGGTTISVTNTLNQSAAAAVTAGTTTVTGSASTTAVSVSNVKGTIATGGSAVYNTVDINDLNVTSSTTATAATKAGTITTVSLAGTVGANVSSAALNTLNLSGTHTVIGLYEGGSNAATNTALALNLNGATVSGSITDNGAGAGSGQFKTININTGATAGVGSSLATAAVAFVDTALTTINIAGAGNLTGADLSVGSVTAINAGGTGALTMSGNVTATINATVATYTGGAGNDTITVGTVSKALTGGTGTDTLISNTATYAVNALVSGFDVLGMGASADGAFNATGFTGLTVGAITGNSEFTNVAAGTSLTVTAAPNKNVTYTLANATGLSDSVTINIANVNGGATILTPGVETVNIASTNTSGIAITNTLTITDADATSVTLTSGALTNIALTQASTALRTVDASGVKGQGGSANTGFIFTSGAVVAATGSLTVKGSVAGGDAINLSASLDGTSITAYAGTNALTGSLAAANTITGGTGADTIIAGNLVDTIVGGGGADIITGGKAADSITLGTGSVTINYLTLSSGTNSATGVEASVLTTGFDVVNNVNAGDILKYTDAGTIAANLALTFANNLAGVNDETALALGTYNAASNTFTYSATGTDTLLTYDTTVGAAGGFEAVVLVGYAATATNTSIAGDTITFA